MRQCVWGFAILILPRFTQSISDAIDQYRFDRIPRPKGQGVEPLLNFPSGALVHFAVSNSEVHMTTRLAGPETAFLPFNKGDNGGKGNSLSRSMSSRAATRLGRWSHSRAR
jgi:type I restriction enzyme, R subunit